MNIFSIILPLVLLIVGGYLLRRAALMPDEWIHTLSNFVYRVSLPALIAASFWGIPWHDPALARLVGAGLAALLAFALLAGILLALTPMNRRTKASVFLSAMVGNTIYLGFPLGEAAFGEGSRAAVVALGTLFLAGGILTAVLGIELFWQPEGTRSFFRSFLRNPLLIALAAGLLLSLGGVSVDNPFHRTLALVGVTASPLALVALGAFLYGRFVREASWYAVLAAALRLTTAPIVAFLTVALVGARHTGLGAATVLAAMPVAVTAFAVAEELDLEVSVVASSIVASTAAALVTVPLILSLWV